MGVALGVHQQLVGAAGRVSGFISSQFKKNKDKEAADTARSTLKGKQEAIKINRTASRKKIGGNK